MTLESNTITFLTFLCKRTIDKKMRLTTWYPQRTTCKYIPKLTVAGGVAEHTSTLPITAAIETFDLPVQNCQRRDRFMMHTSPTETTDYTKHFEHQWSHNMRKMSHHATM